MKKFELVIAGGGLTAAHAIKSYRESGGAGQIALLSNERDLPYHRPGPVEALPARRDDRCALRRDAQLLPRPRRGSAARDDGHRRRRRLAHGDD